MRRLILGILYIAGISALAWDIGQGVYALPFEPARNLPVQHETPKREAAPDKIAQIDLFRFLRPARSRRLKPKQPTAEIPLPRPRPLEAGQEAVAVAPSTAPPEEPPVAQETTTNTEPPVSPTPSECFVALTKDLADAEALPPIVQTNGNGCEAPDVVKLHAVVLADDNKTRISINPPATLRCTMATEIARWVREDLAAATAPMGTLTGIENYDSFECRGRNRVPEAKLSEHGRANALDVRALLLTGKQRITLTDPLASHEFREKIRAQVCGRFSTVLGPGSDGYHEEHIHLDLIERRNDYHICQWNVLDVPLPLPRPPEADVPAEPASEQTDSDIKPDGGKKL